MTEVFVEQPLASPGSANKGLLVLQGGVTLQFGLTSKRILQTLTSLSK